MRREVGGGERGRWDGGRDGKGEREGGERIAEKDEVIFKGRAEMVESKTMTHF